MHIEVYHDVMWRVNKERHRELSEMAANHRLINGSRTERRSRKERLFTDIGDWLVDLGLRLKSDHEPMAQCTCPSQSR